MPRFMPLAVGVALAAVGAAVPAALAGTISGSVFQDYNSNGAKDVGGFVSASSVAATDAGVAGVVVRAFDNAGNSAGQATTGADGSYSMQVSASGTVRVEFERPSGYQSSFAGTSSGTSVQFVDGAGATGVNYGVSKPGEYCQNNPSLVTCAFPNADMMTAAPSRGGAITMPAAFSEAQTFDQRGVVDGRSSETTRLSAGTRSLTPAPNLGSVFGVGVDRAGFAYFGTYVKRHAPYGPAGAVNAIYRVDIATGAHTTFAVLGASSLPAHNAAAPSGYPAYSVDGIRGAAIGSTYYSNVYPNVGRAGIGDVDVSADGSTLYAVEMTENAPKLWIVPIDNPGARTSVDIPGSGALGTFSGVACTGAFHPMGLGIRGDRILVGGVCGGDASRWVDPGTGRTDAAAFVLSFDATTSAFSTVAATSLGYAKGGAYRGQLLMAWNATTDPSSGDSPASGLWHNWRDAAPAWSPSNPGYAAWYRAWAEPMLANIEIMDNGDLVLGFRDRFQDQVSYNAVEYDWNGTGTPPTRNYWDADVAAAEILRMCANANGTYTRESNGACNGITGAGGIAGESSTLRSPAVPAGQRANSPLFYAASWVRSDWDGLGMGSTYDCSPSDFYECSLHPYTSLGGTASLPGSPVLWATTFDINSYFQQGVRAFGPCPTRAAVVGTCGPSGAADGAALGGVVLNDDGAGSDPFAFRKGNGLGDLELVCNSAPVQIGNRVWIDGNANGLQDPGEEPVVGVTVHLYDANGTLVGTAITDAQGQYYFSSTVVRPASGDGTNTGGGLVVGQAFVIRLDNPADFAGSGPLAGYSLTTNDVATAPAGANATSINSKATTSGGFPQMSVPARGAGINSHVFDAGFVKPPGGTPAGSTNSASSSHVAIGDYVWFDANRNGLQDAGERPVKGALVVLLDANGARARNAAGAVVPVQRTDAKGTYLFGGLLPGRYRVRFVYPKGYEGTIVTGGNTRRDSNPPATPRNRRVALTPVFRVYGTTHGTTRPFRRTGVDASYADLTIDAGLVLPAGAPVGVTG